MSQTETPQAGPQTIFERYLSQGQFMIQRSKSTGEYVFYPRISTPSGATDLEWVQPAGTGKIYAITVNRARSGATNVALITLDEGVRMMSTLPKVEIAPIGARVVARIEQAEGGSRVVFDLMEGEGA